MESPERDIRLRRIAVVRALAGLGDLLCAIPALRALRISAPHARISLIGLPAGRWLLERFGDLVDSLVSFPGYPGIPEPAYSPARLAGFLARVHRAPFDLALQMHNGGVVTNAFSLLLGARETAGLFDPAQGPPARGRFFPYPDRGAEVHRCLALTTALGMPDAGDRLSFPVTDADRAALASHAALGSLEPGSYVCIHAGAPDAARRWPAAHFSHVAEALVRRGYRVVLTGIQAERDAAQAVEAGMRHAPVNAVGATSLGVAAALLEHAALLVTNDTGISHLAAALQTPSVVVFLASDADRWAPIDRSRHRVVGNVPGVSGVSGTRGNASSRASCPEPARVLDEAVGLLQGEVAA